MFCGKLAKSYILLKAAVSSSKLSGKSIKAQYL